MSNPYQVAWQKLHPKANIPQYATDGSAAVDLKTLTPLTIYPGEKITIHTGLACAIPRNYVGIIAPRSGLGIQGLILANTIGVIDSDYRGEIKVVLWNKANEEKTILEGARIAQMMFLPCAFMQHIEVDSLDETARGVGGFGSTGN